MRKTAKIGLWFNKRSAEYLWRHGQDLFQLYLEEVLGHAGIPYTRFDDADTLSPIIPISSSSHAGEKEDLNRLEQWARQGATLISYGGLNRMAGRLGCTRFAIRDAVYGNLSGLKYAQGIPVLRAVISDPWMVSQTSVMPVEADGVLRRLKRWCRGVRGRHQVPARRRTADPLECGHSCEHRHARGRRPVVQTAYLLRTEQERWTKAF